MPEQSTQSFLAVDGIDVSMPFSCCPVNSEQKLTVILATVIHTAKAR